MSRPSLVLLNDKKNLIGVEIGVQAGHNAKWMLENLDIQKLYLIDSYGEFRCNNNKPIDDGGLHPASLENKEVCKKRLKKWEDKIEYIYKYSFDAIDDLEKQSVDFIYIDGDHRYEILIKDLEYISKIKLGGLLCGHDWAFPSVKKAVSEFVNSKQFEFTCCGTKQYITTCDKNTIRDDWWIYIPVADVLFIQKCKMCQKVHTFTVHDILWLG